MTPARDRIVDALRWGALTVEELAARVELTGNGVRAQLAILQRDGLVEPLGVRPTGEAGKPPVLYGLTHAAHERLSEAYPPSLIALIESVRAIHGEHGLLQVLSEAGRHLADRSNERDPIRLLESLGAQPRLVSVGSDQVRLEGPGCPLSAAVREQPLSCELVRAMLAAATGVPVTQRCKHGDTPQCCFDISSRA
jgi:predicted ArsR family transcriptional regulator